MLSREEEESKQLIRAQRLAKRTRASAACLPCKSKKAKCNDYRPCARCQRSPGEVCIDDNPEITSNMYPANITRACIASRDQASNQERGPSRVAFVSDNPYTGLSDAFDTDESMFAVLGYESTGGRAFATTLQVCI